LNFSIRCDVLNRDDDLILFLTHSTDNFPEEKSREAERLGEGGGVEGIDVARNLAVTRARAPREAQNGNFRWKNAGQGEGRECER